MAKDIPIKEFRGKLAEMADRVERGEIFRVMRRSKPSFLVLKITSAFSPSLLARLERELQEERKTEERALGTPALIEEEQEWETCVDFTDGGKEEGMEANAVLRLLRKIDPSPARA